MLEEAPGSRSWTQKANGLGVSGHYSDDLHRHKLTKKVHSLSQLDCSNCNALGLGISYGFDHDPTDSCRGDRAGNQLVFHFLSLTIFLTGRFLAGTAFSAKTAGSFFGGRPRFRFWMVASSLTGAGFSLLGHESSMSIPKRSESSSFGAAMIRALFVLARERIFVLSCFTIAPTKVSTLIPLNVKKSSGRLSSRAETP